MLRTAATHLRRQVNVVRSSNHNNRTMITSAQKRALKKDQIKGGESSTSSAKPPIAGASPAATAEAGGGGGGGGSSLPLLAGVGIAGAGAAYYMDVLPLDMIMGGKEEEKKVDDSIVSVSEAAVEKEEADLSIAIAEEEAAAKTVEVVEEKKEEEPVVVVEKKKTATGNRVLQITAPSGAGRQTDPLPEVSHVEGGNRVSVAKFAGGDTEKDSPVPVTDAPTGELAAQAEDELKTPSLPGKSVIDEELARAHASMKASVDESYLKNLDDLSPSDLRIKIVQLASEMSERTKWEAVRLREFLGMKEKEVGDKYLELMQKQRLEFEDLLARRLREQEANITKAANDALEAKEKSIESVVNAAASAQEQEYNAALKSSEARMEREISAKYESEFGSKLAEAKNDYLNDLKDKVASIDLLSKRLKEAQDNLQISRNFESGSQRAHRVSAAALALSEKMESSKGAAEEYAALKSAAVENGVIASALETIPTSVKKGIPTLPELQGSFDGVYNISRQAAYVPKGRSGVEGQLAGKLFAKLTVPPSSDASPPADESDSGKMADYILARAKQHIEIGELEAAVRDLDQLSGQVAFTVKDWKSAAMDRIAVEKALKVIKMECALMNKNMGG